MFWPRELFSLPHWHTGERCGPRCGRNGGHRADGHDICAMQGRHQPQPPRICCAGGRCSWDDCSGGLPFFRTCSSLGDVVRLQACSDTTGRKQYPTTVNFMHATSLGSDERHLQRQVFKLRIRGGATQVQYVLPMPRCHPQTVAHSPDVFVAKQRILCVVEKYSN